MEWVLVEQCPSGASDVSWHLVREALTLYLARTEAGIADLCVRTSKAPNAESEADLARIARSGSYVRLEAVGTVAVKPEAPRWHGGAAEPYLLRSSAEQKEIMLLRAGDIISFPDRPDLGVTLTLELTRGTGEVLVDSSVGAAVTAGPEVQKEDPDEEKPARSGDASETEDDDLDAVPVTISNGNRSQNTPAPAACSQIVQETPTVNRVTTIEVNSVADDTSTASKAGKELHTLIANKSPRPLDGIEVTPISSRNRMGSQLPETLISQGESNASRKPSLLGDIVDSKEHDDAPIGRSEERAHHVSKAAQHTPSEAIPSLSNTAETTELKAIETKRTSRASPMVLIKEPKARLKRKSSATLETTTPIRAKRSKSVPDAPQDVDPPSTVKRTLSRKISQPKKASTPKVDSEQGMPSSSAGSRSTPNPEDIWQGEPPKVAFSNSGLPSMVNMMKFLRQHGGSAVDTVQKGKCDLLCVRQGPLRKSMKLLSSLALGIPIVTDKWLIESARKEHFMKPNAYIPHAPDQEREWGFSLIVIWGKPQSGILHKKNVNFTPALKQSYDDFSEVEALCRLLGASKVDTKAASKIKKRDDVVFLALEPAKGKDPDRTELIKQGCNVYSRDLLTSSVLRGKLVLDSDEFRLKK